MTYQQPPQAMYQQQPKNGLGTAALVLGIIGLLLAWIPIIGFFGFVLGALAVILGIIGIVRTRKGTATNTVIAAVGTGLGAVAFVLSIVVFGAFANELDKQLNNGNVAASTSEPLTQETVVPAQSEPGGPMLLAFGESHTWDGGETITVSVPEEYTPENPFLAPQGDQRLVAVDVTVRNDGNDEYQVMSTMLTAQHNGRVAQEDFMAGDVLPNVQLPPGGETTFTSVYQVGAEPGELQISVQPNVFAADTVYFNGQF